MKSRKMIAMLLGISTLLSFSGCGTTPPPTNNSQIVSESEENMTTSESNNQVVQEITEEEPETNEMGNKQVIVYYPNWHLESKEAKKGGEVGSIAWDSVTIINHAFFQAYPADGTSESSFDRKANNLEARTSFQCVSTQPKADFEDEITSVYNNLARNHFTQYEYYAEKYPDVKIMISVGGWTNSGFFSEMSYTKEGRSSFIASCVDLMKEYPFIGGIDIDWEYPAGSPDGQRYPENSEDQGCPIWGSPAEDNENFALLLSEMRETFDNEFGQGNKYITACASGSSGWTLPCQNWPAFAPYLDYINIMTYDLAGKWAGVTGHHSPENLTKAAMAFFMNKKIDMSKVNIGSPMYPIWLKVDGDEMPKYVVGAKVDINATMSDEYNSIEATQSFEKESVTGYTYSIVDGKCEMGETFDKSNDGALTGWHSGFDDKAGAAYVYNDDKDSPFYMWFATYENPLSLQRKIDLVHHYKLAGIIVWESTQDTEDDLMINYLSEGLNGTK